MADNDLQHSGELDYEAPFDDADADLIVHSSDGKHFRVFKVILRKASTFFADMFTLPPPPNHNPETPQDVTMLEDGETVKRLLWMCYPMEEPDSTELGLTEIKTLLAAADKYGMLAINQRSAKLLQGHVQASPLSVYAIAVFAKLDAVALAAAQHCLRRPQSDIVHADIPEIDLLVTSAYQKLLRYHAQCTSTAVALVTGYSFPWITNSEYCWFKCTSCGLDPYMVTIQGGRQLPVAAWWRAYMNKTAEELKHSGPLVFSVPGRQILLPPNHMVRNCNCFSGSGINDLLGFMKVLQATIESAVLEVEHKL